MSKKQAPTFSQLTYIVTGILSAHTQRGDELTHETVKKAVTAARIAYEDIEDIINEYNDDHEEEEELPKDVFADYPWDGTPQRYTDIANWLRGKGVTSNRRISMLLTKACEDGYLMKDDLSGKYIHTHA